MARRLKPTRSRAKSKRATVKIKSIPITKTDARKYREAKNPDYNVRIVRHGKKPAEYFVDVKHASDEKVEVLRNSPGEWGIRIAKTRKLKSGEVRKTDIPFQRVKLQEFLKKAEKDPDAINALKEPDEFFSFTLEDNQAKATFIDIRFALQQLQQYLKTGSKGAHITLYNMRGDPSTWRKHKTVKDKTQAQRERRNVRERNKRFVRKRQHGHAYSEDLSKTRSRVQRFRENLRNDPTRYEAYKKQQRKYAQEIREEKKKAAKREAIKARREAGKRATQQRARNRARKKS